MKPDTSAQKKFNQLRRQAEKLMTAVDFVKTPVNFDDPLKLIHELQTFQIEMELQIEELHRSQQAFLESNIRYTELYDFAPVGYITLDLNGLILNANLTFADMLSIQRSALMNQSLTGYIIYEDQDIYYRHMGQLSDSKTEQMCELHMIKQDGTSFDAQLKSTLVLNKSGTQAQTYTVVSDISRQKAAEEKRDRLESKLFQAKKMETIGNLAGGIAHDFNNILFIIMGNTELAMEEIPGTSPAYANLERIKAAGSRASEIVKLLLNYSCKTVPDLKPVDISNVLKDGLKLLRSLLPSTIDIQENFSITHTNILADPAQINQAMMNLCINASQEMEHSGGVIGIGLDTVTIDEQEARAYPDLTSGEYAKITITDTGPGIDPKIVDRIFDPYFTTKPLGKIPGMGMGLAVVLGIVKTHGGAITMDSCPGKGATFRMLFPVTHTKPTMADTPPEKRDGGKKTILFIDDEPAITDMSKKMLERLGYRVETASDPEKALAVFKTKPDFFDLVITDMTMPKITGDKLAGKIKEIRSDIPVIIFTGHSAHIDEEKARQLGISGYLMKPVSMVKMAKIIQRVLDT